MHKLIGDCCVLCIFIILVALSVLGVQVSFVLGNLSFSCQ